MEYVLVCQHDHQFSAYNNREYFEKCIDEAIEKKIKVLCSGPTCLKDAFSASDNSFWISRFSTPKYNKKK